MVFCVSFMSGGASTAATVPAASTVNDLKDEIRRVRGTASFFQLFSTEIGEDPLRSHDTVTSLGLIPGTGPHQLFAVEEEGGDAEFLGTLRDMTCNEVLSVEGWPNLQGVESMGACRGVSVGGNDRVTALKLGGRLFAIECTWSRVDQKESSLSRDMRVQAFRRRSGCAPIWKCFI